MNGTWLVVQADDRSPRFLVVLQQQDIDAHYPIMYSKAPHGPFPAIHRSDSITRCWFRYSSNRITAKQSSIIDSNLLIHSCVAEFGYICDFTEEPFHGSSVQAVANLRPPARLRIESKNAIFLRTFIGYFWAKQTSFLSKARGMTLTGSEIFAFDLLPRVSATHTSILVSISPPFYPFHNKSISINQFIPSGIKQPFQVYPGGK